YMSEPGKTDRWSSLLETLGVPATEQKQPAAADPAAEAPSAAPAKPQPVSMLRPKKTPAPAKPKSGPPAAKSPSYWSRIAGALGLEVPAPVEPQIEPQAEPPKPQRTEE